MENQDGPKDPSRPVSGHSQAQPKEESHKSQHGSQADVAQNEVANPDGEVAQENANAEALDGSPAAADQEDGALADGEQGEDGQKAEEDGQVDGQEAAEGESPVKEQNEEGEAVDGEGEGQQDGQAEPKEEEESPEVLAKKEEFELENDPCMVYKKNFC